MQENGFRYVVVTLEEGRWSSMSAAKRDPEELLQLYVGHPLLQRLPDDSKGIARYRADATILNTFSVGEALRRHDGVPLQLFADLVKNNTIRMVDVERLIRRQGTAVPQAPHPA